MMKGLLAFWRSAGSAHRMIAFLWIVGLAVTALQLVLPTQVGRLTNMLTLGGESVTWRQIDTAIVLMLCPQIAVAALTFLRFRLMDRLRQRLVASATLDMYRRITLFDPEFFRDNQPEAINSRVLDDLRTTTTFWFDLSLKMPLVLTSLLVYGAFMVCTNWFFAACTIPLSFLSCYFLVFDRRIQKINRDTHDAWGRVRTQAREYVAGIEEVRPNNAFGYGMGQLEGAFRQHQAASDHASRIRAILGVGTPVVTAVQDSVLYWIGAALCLLTLKSVTPFGPVNWGDVIKFMLAANLFRKPLSELVSAIQDWRLNALTLESAREYDVLPVAFADPSASPAPRPTSGSGIGFRKVDVRASSGTRLLHRITLDIRDGEHVAFVGPAGCGKSTAIQLLFRSSRPSSGSVLLRELAIDELSLGDLARETGVVRQTPFLLNASIRDNLLWALRRPSPRTIRDGQGEVDISTLPDVTTPSDLNRELVRMVRAVGLDADALRLALDAPVSPELARGALIRELPRLRTRIAERLAENPAARVIRFERATWVRSLTLRNNITFGCIASPATPASATTLATCLRTALDHARLVEPLLKIGLSRLRSDSRVAATLSRRTRDMDILFNLAGSPAAEGSGRRLLHPGQALTDPAVCAILLDAALDLESERAAELLHIPDFEARMLAARTHFLNAIATRGGAFQDYLTPGRLEGLSLRELLLMGRVDAGIFRAEEQADLLIREVLEECGLLPDTLLAGLEFKVGENGRALSSVQRQKVAIGRALLKRPTILLLDDATSTLDEEARQHIARLIDTDYRGCTVVAISHRLSAVRGSHRVFVFDRGALAQQGAWADLAAQPGVFRSMLAQQDSGAGLPPETQSAAEAGPPAENGDLLKHQLAQCDLFASLTSDQIEVLTRVAKVVQCPAGTTLFRRGDTGDELFVILEGQVEFFVEETAPAGGVTTTSEGVAGPYQAFGEIAVLSGERRTLGARTRAQTSLALIHRDALLRTLESSPAMARPLLQTLALRITRMREERYGR